MRQSLDLEQLFQMFIGVVGPTLLTQWGCYIPFLNVETNRPSWYPSEFSEIFQTKFFVAFHPLLLN